ncbi:MAG: winged helix-turn-helix transcriptional regulator [Planctomycetes bacterium]|nr:winged helix-turn-helix transcriptional regulator [Planctomycetota bacterium]
METSLDLSPLESLEEAAECLKVLGHPIRLRMVEILMQGEFPVREMAELCQLPPHQACEHLRILKSHGLLTSQRRGRSVYYQIADARLPRLLNCIRTACGFCEATATETENHQKTTGA